MIGKVLDVPAAQQAAVHAGSPVDVWSMYIHFCVCAYGSLPTTAAVQLHAHWGCCGNSYEPHVCQYRCTLTCRHVSYIVEKVHVTWQH